MTVDTLPRTSAWRRRKAFRETEILEAAGALLVEVGANDLSMIEIARRAGVSEATVYKYFESRQELVARAMVVAITPLIASMEEDVERITGCEARLRFFIAQSLRDMGARPNLHRAAHGHMRWYGEHKFVLRDLHRRFGRLVQSIFDRGIKDGEIRADADFVLAGDMLFGGIESVGWRTLLVDREMSVSIDEFAAVFARQLIGGMRAEQTKAMSLCDRLENLIDRMERKVPG